MISEDATQNADADAVAVDQTDRCSGCVAAVVVADRMDPEPVAASARAPSQASNCHCHRTSTRAGVPPPPSLYVTPQSYFSLCAVPVPSLSPHTLAGTPQLNSGYSSPKVRAKKKPHLSIPVKCSPRHRPRGERQSHGPHAPRARCDRQRDISLISQVRDVLTCTSLSLIVRRIDSGLSSPSGLSPQS